MGPIGFVIGPYASVWVIMGPYGSLCVYIAFKGS